ncbi:uncharacterized protein LOC100382845 [Zea mays]|uniref:Uncharacterized protein n=1 Tax=Zea mays TaxID=4577 RepID=C0PB63_MAIZE|nr:uncharacterized protein LOC100382845 [Zea mays]ACN31408.1 unknown [Zea mays]|eukprot:NP_001169013.1 uncharacterized protein LOC100382845 [Zea mays]
MPHHHRRVLPRLPSSPLALRPPTLLPCSAGAGAAVCEPAPGRPLPLHLRLVRPVWPASCVSLPIRLGLRRVFPVGFAIAAAAPLARTRCGLWRRQPQPFTTPLDAPSSASFGILPTPAMFDLTTPTLTPYPAALNPM